MAKRGPQPGNARLPTALRQVRGLRTSHHPVNEAEPFPELCEGPVAPPRRLSPRALVIWRETTPGLQRLRLLTEADLYAWADYCGAVAMGEEYEAEVRLISGEISELRREARKVVWRLRATGSARKEAEATFLAERGLPRLRTELIRLQREVRAQTDQALRIGARFGRTPSDRTSLRSPTVAGPGAGPAQEPHDELERRRAERAAAAQRAAAAEPGE